MPEEPWGHTPRDQEDRLAALRGAAGATPQTRSSAPRQRMARELVLGVVLLLLGAVIVLVYVSSRTASTPTVETAVPAGEEPQPASLVPGLALVPALVERGSFPPGIATGDHVIVVVSPDPGEDRPARVLEHGITVADVSSDGSMSGGTVITLVGPESLARDIADAGKVHVSVVAEGGK